MNVLVVGGAGYLGGALTDILQRSADSVRVYDALLFEEAYLKQVPFYLGDIRDHTRLRQHLDWADTVVWLAALVGDGACALDPEITVAVNQDAVAWLAANFDGRIVFLSTCSVYGEREQVCTEDTPTKPLSLYAQTKLAAEQALALKNAITFRLATLFGLGDTHARTRLDLVVNTLTAKAVTEQGLRVFGGDQYRPLLHVRDAAQAIADSLHSHHTGVFNLHSENTTILDLARLVAEHVPGARLHVENGLVEDCRSYQVSSVKAMRTLGFRPRLDPSAGIREVRTLMEQARIKDMTNPRYSNEGYLAKYHTHAAVSGGW